MRRTAAHGGALVAFADEAEAIADGALGEYVEQALRMELGLWARATLAFTRCTVFGEKLPAASMASRVASPPILSHCQISTVAPRTGAPSGPRMRPLR